MCVVIVVLGGLWAEASDVPFEFEATIIVSVTLVGPIWSRSPYLEQLFFCGLCRLQQFILILVFVI